MARPRAWLLFLFGWIPFRKHPAVTLTIGVVASAALFSFIEPGFPTEKGALQYLIGMLLGFALVSLVFFTTWRLVIHRLEPDGTGRWEIYPPFILLAAFLVVMARLAHFMPGVVLGTVAEYEPAKKLSRADRGDPRRVTYGALIVLGPGRLVRLDPGRPRRPQGGRELADADPRLRARDHLRLGPRVRFVSG